MIRRSWGSGRWCEWKLCHSSWLRNRKLCCWLFFAFDPGSSWESAVAFIKWLRPGWGVLTSPQATAEIWWETSVPRAPEPGVCAARDGVQPRWADPTWCLNLRSSRCLPTLLWNSLALPHARAASGIATLLARSHSAHKPYECRETHQEKTQPHSCALDLQCLEFLRPLSLWCEQGQPSTVHGLQPTHSQPGIFQRIFPASQFRTLPHYYFASEIMIKIIPFFRVQWKVDSLKPAWINGTNAIIPCLMEAVGYQHMVRHDRELEGRTENQVFLYFFFFTRHILKPFLAYLGMGYPGISSSSCQ